MCLQVYFIFFWSVGLKIETIPTFVFHQMSPFFPSARLKLTICSVIKESLFQMRQFYKHEVQMRPFLDLLPDYTRLTVVLFYVVSMTTVWVRPPIKPTSAVISSPKSFVIALICILQLSVLAHSKNNQPPLRTGDGIIIISVDLYETLLTSLCLMYALNCQTIDCIVWLHMLVYCIFTSNINS